MTTDLSRRPRILVADDDGVTRAIVSRWLDRSGFEVFAARDGSEALSAAAECAPELLLLDVTMPDLDGYAVCRAIQSAGDAAPPVIFLTASAHTDARVEGLEAGAVDYIVKPFEQAELLARVRAALRTKTVRDRFAERAVRDGLTGLLNRAEMDVRADAAIRFAQRHDGLLSCLMVDVDHFKRINDGWGHLAGDEVLRECARRIAASCRASDVVGRYGGEEFVLLLPGVDGIDAATTGDKIRRLLSERVVVVDGGVELEVTASVGAAGWGGSMDVGRLYARADDALYEAKRAGRNRTVLHRP